MKCKECNNELINKRKGSIYCSRKCKENNRDKKRYVYKRLTRLTKEECEKINKIREKFKHL